MDLQMSLIWPSTKRFIWVLNSKLKVIFHQNLKLFFHCLLASNTAGKKSGFYYFIGDFFFSLWKLLGDVFSCPWIVCVFFMLGA